MAEEEIVAVRKARHEISAECGHDVRKVAAYCRTVGERLRQAAKQRSKKSPSRRLQRTRKATPK
jgi:hypothetical protein